ncbi:hypothetical protein OS175_13465 [Marinicella sp. S1101]|uniref:hypothetical protein n=1 Tax=Marinicella marina TaxID=2996016 RepID=UPI002260D411|nr:hypothetical protein [Marinicella marina]MCX7554882.1 hypothetical protein [Marinicella marina]MDJ1141294.1 hypothetical protein [Marinicella marina]
MKQATKKQLQTYIDKFSRAVDLSAWPLDQSWQNVMILPVCAESHESVVDVFQHLSQPSVLVILVLNRPEKHPQTNAWSEQNNNFKQALLSDYNNVQHISADHCLLTAGTLPDVLFLDFNRSPFNHNEGVGLARRIAADTACALIGLDCIKAPWIFSTDADVTLPSGYFKVVDDYPDAAALSLGFNHHSKDKTMAAHQQKYDFKLKYYQLGVKFIGAAYDYIPLGSTLVINAIAYVKVRGFPVRSGGEDFYILNKLAKVGNIEQPAEPVVQIKVRQSDRVPFGTGPAVRQIATNQQSGVAMNYYHPMIFVRLKQWRDELFAYYNNKALPQDKALNDYWDIQQVINKAEKQIQTATRWQQFTHEWLDAFRILKSVHFLQAFHPNQTRQELSQHERFIEIMAVREGFEPSIRY